MQSKAYIIDGVRTPIGKFGGSLSPVRADDLLATTISALMRRNSGIPGEDIDEVIMGCANQAGEDNRNVARMSLLLAGLPVSVPGYTVNRLCASGMTSVVDAARAIYCGEADLIIAGGMEHMTRGPWVMSKTSTPFGRDVQLYDSSFGWRFINHKMEKTYGVDAMGQTAENLAEMFNISREDQDSFALWSQQKAAKAADSGRLAREICEVEIAEKKGSITRFGNDEFIKPQTTIEGLAGLRASFKATGTVTAGNSSGLNDGAASLLIASEKAVKKYNLNPLASIECSASAGVEPRIMGIGPVHATEKALSLARLGLKDMDILELNEAFASQVLACTRKLGLEDRDPRLNPNGGAIALGHPLGMSGARLCMTAAMELQDKKLDYALATMCIGVGQGVAVILKRS